MAAGSAGVPGLAVAMATAGGFLVYIGIRDVPFTSGLRSMLKGKVPEPRPKKVTELPAVFTPGKANTPLNPVGAGAPGQRSYQIVSAATKYLGQPYHWGGAVPTTYGGPGFDCSGFVTWVLHHDLGIGLPDNSHTVTGIFKRWDAGSTAVPFAQMAAGDLVCWEQHMGIAVSSTDMIHAPTAGESVKIGRVWTTPEMPVIRRVK